MSDKIICPICDEELGNGIDQVPEKCPICDTRKHEILQELCGDSSGDKTTFIVENATSEVLSPAEAEQRAAIEAGIIAGAIVEEEIVADGDSPREELASPPSDLTWEPTAVSQLAEEEADAASATEDVVFSETPTLASESALAPGTESSSGSNPVKMAKSGASSLEMLPVGYKHCSHCGKVFARDYPDNICPCAAGALETVDTGFAPGHYLVLYNDQKKAIAYFRLEAQGSIFLGRSSERGSPKDIDLTIAWKHYYQRHSGDQSDFKEKMHLIKGVSRKHALVRYSQEDQKYVLFHLSDKNYTVLRTPKGEKRTRPPKNRNKAELESGMLISLGNQREFIVLRYKILGTGS